MSLNWELSDCEDWEELKSDEEWPITNGIIWLTIAVDMGHITEENWEHFYSRVWLFEKVYGAFLYDANGPRPIKAEEIKRRIGLHTNVPYVPHDRWVMRKIWKEAVERGNRAKLDLVRT